MIKTLTHIFILLLLCGAAQPSSPAQEEEGDSPWVQVSPEGETFTVLMPGRPASATRSYRSGGINATGSVYYV
ncbi:MAG TPA: hypothetical protein VE842_13105, partial [Pyrinomonadaceae bacterium]|nr:hypothetical protein [Pyrinomonadaceae bacterium]